MESGVLQVGPVGGPSIRIDRAGGSVRSFGAAADRLALDPRTVWKPFAGGRGGEEGSGWQAIQALQEKSEKSRTTLVFTRPRAISPAQALQAIERSEHRSGRRLSPALTAACLAASLGSQAGLPSVRRVPAWFAAWARKPAARVPSRLPDEEIDEHVDRFLRGAMAGRVSRAVPEGAVDRARYGLAVSRSLWRCETRRALSQARLPEKDVLHLSRLAGVWMALRPRPLVKVAGVSLRIPEPTMEFAWLQIMEWERGHIAGRVLRYLTGYHGVIPSLSQWHRASRPDGRGDTLPPVDGVWAHDLSRRLLNHLGASARCRPVGSFRVRLPEEVQLGGCSVASLRVWIDPPDAMWVALEPGDCVGPSFRWWASPAHLSCWAFPAWAVPAIHLTMAALWHDLSVGAESMQRTSASRHAGGGGSAGGLSSVRLAGLWSWGETSRAHVAARSGARVRAHLRRLPRGRRPTRSACMHARRHGLARLPAGMTFVRSHGRRGDVAGRRDDLSSPAQGLATVMKALSRHASRAEGGGSALS